MYALFIKPAAMKKSAHRKIVADFMANGAITLKSHDALSLRTEISELTKLHSELTVVACGGDGTVHLALNAIIDLPVSFAILPMGTGNDFARHIGVGKLTDAIPALISGKTELVDVGTIELANGELHYFGAVASCGFDAQVNERANLHRGPNGPAKYLAAVFGELRELKSLNLSLKFDDQRLAGKFCLIAIGNTSSYGGGMQITPAADLQDGVFAGTLVGDVARRTLVKVLPRVFSGSHVFHPAVSVVQFGQMEISGESFPIYADGERIGFGPAKFKVRPACLRLVVADNT